MPSRLPARQQSLAETPPAASTERPAVRAYRLQLQRVDKLRAQLSDIDTLAQWQRDERLRATVPLQRQAQRLAADLVRALDAALQDAPDDGLGPRRPRPTPRKRRAASTANWPARCTPTASPTPICAPTKPPA